MQKKLLLLPLVSMVVACGGAPPPPPAAPAEEPAPVARKPLPQVQQELGSIDQRAVEKTFERLQTKLEKCHDSGREKVDTLFGDVKVFLRVDQSGKVRYGYLEDSSIGELDTEKCILSVFSSTQWPKPEGGEAEIRHGFGWPGGGERAPTKWGPEKVLKALEDSKGAKKDVEKCKAGVSGDFIVTGYVAPDGKHGKFQGVGATPPDKAAADKVECIVDAVKGLKLPSPGGYAAKVTFAL